MYSGGRTKSSIPGNLARYMFYKRCKQLGEDRLAAFMKLAGKVYNPLNPPLEQHVEEHTDEEVDSGDE